MVVVMLSVLGAGTTDEVVKSTHLGLHVFHLLINNADCFCVHRFGGKLKRRVVLVRSLDVS